MQARLNDVYTDPKISKWRNELLNQFILQMKQADSEADIAKLGALRASARQKLNERAKDSEAIANKDVDVQLINVAQAELFRKAENYAEAISNSRTAIMSLSPGLTKSAAYIHLIESLKDLGDLKNADAEKGNFEKEMEAAAREATLPIPPFGTLRTAIENLQQAQRYDDRARQDYASSWRR